MKIKTERYFKLSDSFVRAIDKYNKSLVIFLSKNGDAISAAKSFRYLDSTDRRVRLELIEPYREIPQLIYTSPENPLSKFKDEEVDA